MADLDNLSVYVHDSRSLIRKDFLKKWFSNNYDVLRFFYFLVQQTKQPIFGRYFLRPVMESYYHNIHPGSFILPRKEIEAIIKNSSALYIDPCICRLFHGNCDTPIYTCLRINFSAEVRQRQKGKRLSKNDALHIVANARKYGLILSLEHCIRPYQYNICMCCRCCCVPKQFRYQFGLDVYRSGPYMPEVDEDKCRRCGRCIKKCPVSAIFQDNEKMRMDTQLCLGCGICEETCPHHAITMKYVRPVRRDESEPSSINLLFKYIGLHLVLIPLVALFRLGRGSRQNKVEDIVPRKSDVDFVSGAY